MNIHRTHRAFDEFSSNAPPVRKFEPYISLRSHLTPTILLLLWADIANQLCTGQICHSRGVGRKTVQEVLHSAANAALSQEQSEQYEFSRIQVDETFIGKRKYQRGRRQRKRGWWFATVTEIRGQEMGRTHWKLVKRRDTETLHNFILPHLTSARAVVVSDCWGAYSTLGDFCRHHAVNHSVEFVNSQGYHTNTAEGSHRIIKDWVRKQHYNFGASSLELMRNVALQCVKLGEVHNGRETAWQTRLSNLLGCFLEYYGSDVDDFDDSVSLSSCPSDYTSGDDFVSSESEGHAMHDE